jgi:uncharacterized protein YcnI
VRVGSAGEVQLDDAEAKPGWAQSRTQQAITWSGGVTPKRQYATFSVRGTAPEQTETVLFNVLVGDRTGKSNTYRVPLAVVAQATGDDSESLGKTALIVAIVAAAIAIGAGLLALYLWLRPPRDGNDLGEV